MSYIQKIKLKTGTAFRIFYSKQGKRYNYYMEPGHTFGEAKRKALELDEEKVPHPKSLTQLSLSDLRHRYNSDRANEILVSRNLLALDLLIHYLGHDFLLSEIGYQKIHEYRDWLFTERMKKYSKADFKREQRVRRGINKELSNLRTIFRWAYRNDLIAEYVFTKVVFFKASNPIPNVLSRAQERLFYCNLPRSQMRLAFKLFKYTGLRRSEATELQWQDLDLDNGYIRLAKTKNRDEDIVPIHRHLAKILRFYRNKYKPAENDKVVPYTPDSITTAFRRALDKAGMHDIKNPVHVLRHTLGTRIMENDISDSGERIAQEILRHKTRHMTKHYTRIAKENLKKKFSTINC